jgi:hypothetical protein
LNVIAELILSILIISLFLIPIVNDIGFDVVSLSLSCGCDDIIFVLLCNPNRFCNKEVFPASALPNNAILINTLLNFTIDKMNLKLKGFSYFKN